MPTDFTKPQQPQVGSTQNARKRSFHAIALLPGEDEKEVLAIHHSICTEYEVTSVLDRFLVVQLVQNILILSRIQNHKQSVVNAALYSPQAKQEFKVAAQLPSADFTDVPDELLKYDPKVVERGEQVAYAMKEARELKESINAANAVTIFSSISAHSSNFLAELHVLGLKQASDALRFLAVRYRGHTANENLKLFVIELGIIYKVALNWYTNEKKYLFIIASLEAKASLELMQDPHLVRYETASFNKILKIRQELQNKKDAKALEAQAIDVTDQNLGGRSKGATGAAKEGAKDGTGAKGLGSDKGSPEVTDVAETTPKQV